MPIVISRLSDVLNHIAAHGPTGFTALHEQLGINRPALTRLLGDAEAVGFIAVCADGRYAQGDQLAALVAAPDYQTVLQRRVELWLQFLRRSCGNSAMAIAWTGQHMVCIGVAVHADALPLQEVGHVAVNLAHAPWGWLFAEQQALALARAKMPTTGSGELPASPSVIKKAIAHYSRHGWLMYLQQAKRRLAAPLTVHGKVIGALSIGGHIGSLSDEQVPACGAALAAAARSCSLLLGEPPTAKESVQG